MSEKWAGMVNAALNQGQAMLPGTPRVLLLCLMTEFCLSQMHQMAPMELDELLDRIRERLSNPNVDPTPLKHAREDWVLTAEMVAYSK